MRRLLVLLLATFACWVAFTVVADIACAQAVAPVAEGAAKAADKWPAPPAGYVFKRGPGYYFNVWKLLGLWLVFLLFVRTSDWVSQDCLRHKLRYGLWNSIIVGVFYVGWIAALAIPFFFVGFPILLLTYFVPLTLYILHRNRKVSLPDIVMNRPHLRRSFSALAGKLGLSVESEKKASHEMGAAVDFKAQGGATERDDGVNLLTARQNPGYVFAKEIVFEAIRRRAESVMMDYGAAAVMTRYQIDGFWHNGEPQERANADLALTVFKTLAALNPQERRARQVGTIGVVVEKKKYDLKVLSQGTQSGERVVLQFLEKKPPFDNFEDLGMRQKMQEELRELLTGRSGMVVVSSMPAGGLTTTFNTVLTDTDRYLRNFVSVEEVHKTERELENVPVTTYDATAGETPATVLPKLIRTYPDVIAVRDPVDGDSLQILSDQAADSRLVITSIRAKEAVEALLRLLMLKVDPQVFANGITAVLNVRLVRKLCDNCKEAYKPPAEVLRQLGLPAGRIEAFYRPPTTPPESEKDICKECQGIGYRGRAGIFELLVVDDNMRQLLATTPKIESLRNAARKAKHRNLQEEGVLLVARGVTSLPEVMRVLKQ